MFTPKIYLGQSLSTITGSANITLSSTSGTNAVTNTCTLNNPFSLVKLNQFITAEEVTTREITRIINITLSVTPTGYTVPIVLNTSISVSVVNSMYSWLASWNNNTSIDVDGIATGKMFIGAKTGTNLSGIYIGNT